MGYTGRMDYSYIEMIFIRKSIWQISITYVHPRKDSVSKEIPRISSLVVVGQLESADAVVWIKTYKILNYRFPAV